MKKFYKLVTTEKVSDRYIVKLDGKSIKTPIGSEIYSTNLKIAEMIVLEWANQDDIINPETMPITQIMTTCIDRVGNDREEIHEFLVPYIDTDLLCYRAESPPEIKKHQENEWDKWLIWFKDKYGIELKTTFSLIAIEQPFEASKKISLEIENLSDLDFTILQLVTSLSGSIVLGLAFIHKAATPEDIFAAANVEENHKAEIYNEEFYGKSPSQIKHHKSVMRDLNACHAILKICS